MTSSLALRYHVAVRRKPMPRRLYFFPAFLPLAELVPWLLALLGAVAGLAGFTAFMRRHRRIVAAFAAILMLAGMGAWWVRGPSLAIRLHGSQAVAELPVPRAFDLPPRPAPLPEKSPGLTLLWNRRADRQILSTPVLAHGLLLYGQYDGGVMALRAADGAPAWFLPTSEPVFALTPAPGGRVYASEGLHYTVAAALIAIDAATGAPAWARRFGGHIEETATLDPLRNRLYTGTGPEGLWALDANDGAPLWHAAIGHLDATPLLLGDTLYVPAQPKEGSDHSVFYALDAANGTTRWSISLPGQPWGSPVADRTGRLILTSTGRGQIGVPRKDDAGWAQAITPNGTIVWQRPLASMPLQPGLYAPEADLIIHALKNGDLVALAAKDGAIVWQASAGGELQAPAVFAAHGRLVAAVTYDGVFTLRDTATGIERARWNVGKYTTAAPVDADDILYVPGAWSLAAFGGLDALADKP
ncbi:MAG: PQQ-binding-like beta-propeller repeat protein [Rhodospirillales bacterium]|nr:PQQ-binding-like beta-propeller repeat protein [Alphaproteobacteria bacterium]MCB9986286.1 PQQ-binding-like beta-propeller repeat protein [Rhodospirillales bacterium]USO07161.1 MAG: PQQ-binding-like beta-propeller repeat protein [Rhodospirillales bacterium]